MSSAAAAAASSTSPVVCVTGAAGFIASWLVKALLAKGVRVKGTVRDPSNPKKTEHLRALAGAEELLTLHKADLLDEGSFDDVIQGCDAVFHTASPFFLTKTEDPQRDLLDPAVKGTENVLGSCVRHKSTVKRVVLTSSTAAIAYDPARPQDKALAEDDWSEPEYCREGQRWYVLSKTLAEKAAWAIAEKEGLDLVAINPAMVVGDLLQPELNTSSEIVLNFLNGQSKTAPNWSVGWVHVEDVAHAHVLAWEKPSASGRYLLISEYLNMLEVCRQLKKIAPEAPVPTQMEGSDPEAPPIPFNNSKAKDLGVNFQPLPKMLQDAIKGLREKGFLSS